MKIAIFGGGRQSKAILHDLVRQPDVKSILVIDAEPAATRMVRERNGKHITYLAADLSGVLDDLVPEISNCAAAISAVPYHLNYRLTKFCIDLGVPFCDLGGNNQVVDKQFSLSAEARKAGVAVIPDCGVAPGLVSVFTKKLVEEFDELDTVKLRVGGLPQNPRPPLNYELTFSTQGLLNEYSGSSVILKNGEIRKVNALSGVEKVNIRGVDYEAFHTTGGSSTLPKSFRHKIRNLSYKTLRYPGHCAVFKTLQDLGYLSGVDSQDLADRLERMLPQGVDDKILIDIVAEGNKNGRGVEEHYSACVLPKDGLTAMMRTTAFSASVILLMLARGEVTTTGVLPQEKVIDHEIFFDELAKRGIKITSYLIKHHEEYIFEV